MSQGCAIDTNLESIPRVLAADPAFAEVPERDFDAFAACLHVVRLAPGEVLFRQGDAGNTLFHVICGRLDVLVTRPGGGQQRLTQLERGDYTGGMALLTGRTRAATVRAASEATLVAIPAAALGALAIAYPRTKASILETTARRLAMLHLASMELFRSLDAELLADIDDASNWLRLPGGGVLFRQGDPADSLFVVVHGCLQVIIERGATTEVVAHIGRGECIGEMGLLTGERRLATVRALRDCELICLSGDEYRRLLGRRPRAILELTQLIVNRLRDTTAGRRPVSHIATIAIAPASDDGLHRHAARALVEALGRQGRRVLHLNRPTIEAHLGEGAADAAPEQLRDHRVVQWLGEQEGRYHHVVFECDLVPTAWSARCVRQADLVLFVAAASADASPRGHEALLRAGAMGHADTPRELLLMHADAATPRDTRRWLDPGRFARHHHARLHADADYERVARIVTGRANGLVLGGGGARGFAHLGALRAFEEARVPIDVIGGTSMGALVGAQYATGYSLDDMIALNRRSFVESNPLRDYTIPFVSLISGTRMERVLRRMFGDAQIEDQWRPYFCIATNLSRATIAVHQQGWLPFAVATSVAIPGLAPPLIHEGDFLVDGGLLDNVPVATMRRVANGTVYAIDVSRQVEFKTAREPYTHLSGWRILRDRLGLSPRRERVPSMLKLLWRSTVLNSVHRSAEVQRLSDVYIRPPLDKIEIFDWKAIDRAIAVGYRATAEALAARGGA